MLREKDRKIEHHSKRCKWETRRTVIQEVKRKSARLQTESIESIIAKMRLLSDANWDSSKESWDENEKSTKSSDERDKENEKKCWKSKRNEQIFMIWKSDDELCQRALLDSRKCQTRHDKHLKVNYKINNIMFLNFRNITISKSLKKLNEKMLKLFKILIEIKQKYQLKLSLIMKIHFKFILNLLQLSSKDSLKKQCNKLLNFIIVKDKDK